MAGMYNSYGEEFVIPDESAEEEQYLYYKKSLYEPSEIGLPAEEVVDQVIVDDRYSDYVSENLGTFKKDYQHYPNSKFSTIYDPMDLWETKDEETCGPNAMI